MKFKTFWVVTKPTPSSTLADIAFETDPAGLARQFAGGLRPEEVHALYAGPRAEREAHTAGQWLLDHVKESP